MDSSTSIIRNINEKYEARFRERQVILTFDEFLIEVKKNPEKYIRNSIRYTADMFDHSGSYQRSHPLLGEVFRFKIFDVGTERCGPIVRGEGFQNEFYRNLKRFSASHSAAKMILFHGPNGSAKSSTIEAIAKGLQTYSEMDEGAVYCFNWIFPDDKDSLPVSRGEGMPIGFSHNGEQKRISSFAKLDESRIASRLTSEFRENPLFLLPMPYRRELLKDWLAKKQKIRPDEVELPQHILGNGLSKRNQQIFETLLNGYEGDISKVFRHIQVERFFFSKHYRIGISSIEPQMSIDAVERQLTLDKNYAQLPAILQTISFHQVSGELIEANRGMLEFSDLLKRPLESFKYLISAIERGCINLPSSTATLDTLFVGTTNEKHLDAFKTIPDFGSFKGRLELIKVPYLLNVDDEMEIYRRDVDAIEASVHVNPHSLEYLCAWAVLTRLKQPNPELYAEQYSALVKRLDPLSKLRLYRGYPLEGDFSTREEQDLVDIRKDIFEESKEFAIYEGRFGASPREIRSLLQRAAQNAADHQLTAVEIFRELELMTKDKTIYDFLQFEARGRYHDIEWFLEVLQRSFVDVFESEVISAMAMAEEAEYDNLLRRYITHVVAMIKNEKLWDEITNSYIAPSQSLTDELEKILQIKDSKEEHRAQLLSRIAASKIDHPDRLINISEVFPEYLAKIKHHFYGQRKKAVDQNIELMINYGEGEQKRIPEQKQHDIELAFKNMEHKGYARVATLRCLKFMLKFKKEHP